MLRSKTHCHFERQNGEKRRGIPISPDPPKRPRRGVYLLDVLFFKVARIVFSAPSLCDVEMNDELIIKVFLNRVHLQRKMM